jgi:hypothetical protein
VDEIVIGGQKAGRTGISFLGKKNKVWRVLELTHKEKVK